MRGRSEKVHDDARCFVDFRTGELRQGKVIAKHPTQAGVPEEATRRTRKIPYVSSERQGRIL